MKRRDFAVRTLLGAGSVLGLSACGVSLRQPGASGEGGASASGDGAPRMDVDAAFAEVSAGRAILVDVRGPESFRQRRAAGSILIPYDQLEDTPRAAAAQIPAGKRAILYCT